MEPTQDYYSILGLEQGATPEEIKRAYRKAVFRYHPDRNPGDDTAAGKFKEVLDAYEVLSDATRRADYDQTRPSNPQGDADKKADDGAAGFGAAFGNGFHFNQDFKKTEAEPKCPSCAVVGTDRIVSRKAGSSSGRGKQFVLAPFNIIFCSACGHVYGVTSSST